MKYKPEEILGAILFVLGLVSPWMICIGTVLVFQGKANILLVLAGLTAAFGGIIVAKKSMKQEMEQKEHEQK